MKTSNKSKLRFRIDKLTHSIENAISGECFQTDVILLESVKEILRKDWKFDWKKEIKNPECDVYKLVTVHNELIIQGLVSVTDKGDHVFMNLIESARFNRGKGKLYNGVMGNLVAFCCKASFEKNYAGIVSFIAKTQLIKHYEQSLGAKNFSGNRMFIDTKEALTLTSRYFKDFEPW